MRVRRRWVVAAVLFVCVGCGDDDPTDPGHTVGVEGVYQLVAYVDSAAPAIEYVPGITTTIDDCGNGADDPNAVYRFDASSHLALQDSPQAFSLRLDGEVVDCAGAARDHLTVIAGEFVLVEGTSITLLGDGGHPHLVGTIAVAPEDTTTEIRVEPGAPGLAYPLAFVRALRFER